MRIIVTIVLGLGFATAGVVVYCNRSPINRENFERLELGMSEKKVEAILGGPALVVISSPFTLHPEEPRALRIEQTHLWSNKQMTIQVGFNADGQVVQISE